MLEQLEGLARKLSDSELRSARYWAMHVNTWATTRGLMYRDVAPEFESVAAAELERRTGAARAAGVLENGHWPFTFDIALRA